jgi:hypothetical protein
MNEPEHRRFVLWNAQHHNGWTPMVMESPIFKAQNYFEPG